VVRAFAPGRVNVIGEHTDYNDGLALPFAISLGVTVSAEAARGRRVEAIALDLAERDVFDAGDRSGATGWRAFVRGAVAELAASGHALGGVRLEFSGTVPRGQGVASSAALEVAVCLALLRVAGIDTYDRLALARLCSRVENSWVGVSTGLLDQLAALFCAEDRALRIDFRDLDLRQVPFALDGWALGLVPSGETRALARTGYEQRRLECRRAVELLGVQSMRDVTPDDLSRLPAPLNRRVLHVIGENERVDAAAASVSAGEPEQLAVLLNESHRSLRDLYDASTPAVESTVARLFQSGAEGARMMGGGFGGQVLALFPPGQSLPADALRVTPAAAAHLVES
jgi:galactokinase